MKSRALNYIAATLGLSLLLPSIALAGPVQINKVQQVIKGSSARGWQDGSSELRPNTTTKADDPVKTTEASDPTKTTEVAAGQQQKPQQDPTQTTVRTETVEEFIEAGECNCPEIPGTPVAGAGFPWWVLGAGAVPLAFIKKRNTEKPPDEAPDSTPTPTPTTPEPEPLTLLLFGTGLLALGVGARRKFAANMSDDKTIGEG